MNLIKDMATICPTVTAEDPHVYRNQLERITPFAKRIHLDFMDGLFTSNKSIDLDQAWMPEGVEVDLHLMYMRPDLFIAHIKAMKPSLVIVHAEAEGAYQPFAKTLHEADIKVGVCLLQKTPLDVIKNYLPQIDHVLVFSGDLGHFGGAADLGLLDKVTQLKHLKPTIEIGWDGGISDKNLKQLIDGGVDVLNVGGFIQKAENPKAKFDELNQLVLKN